jgi:hypothetical protein
MAGGRTVIAVVLGGEVFRIVSVSYSAVANIGDRRGFEE